MDTLSLEVVTLPCVSVAVTVQMTTAQARYQRATEKGAGRTRIGIAVATGQGIAQCGRVAIGITRRGRAGQRLEPVRHLRANTGRHIKCRRRILNENGRTVAHAFTLTVHQGATQEMLSEGLSYSHLRSGSTIPIRAPLLPSH